MTPIAKAPSAARLAGLAGRAARLALPATLLASLGWAYLATLAPSISWANQGADSGDLATAAATLGVAHPAGYPTYLLLARLFMLLPAGDLAWRANLLSAASGLLAVLAIYLLVDRLSGSEDWAAPACAAPAGLALGLAPLFWSQAVIAEVYTLNAAFCAAMLWFVAVPARTRAGQLARGAAVGLALGNHLTSGLFALAWLVAIALSERRAATKTQRHEGLQNRMYSFASSRLRGKQAQMLAPALAGLGAGLLVYLYLPLRAAAHPPVNWGGADSWAGFWWLVSGALYRPLAFGLPPALVGARLAAWAGLLARQFGPLGLALGLAGLIYGAPRARRFVWLTAALFAAQTIFALLYNTSDSEVYLLPALAIFALWIGLGAAAVLAALRARADWAAAPAAVLVAITLLWPAPATFRQVDASRDTRATDYAAQLLAAAPTRAIVLASSDRGSFALWYAQYAQRQRPDAAVVVEPLLDFDWYRANLRAVYPGLVVPDAPQPDWRATLAAANPARPACRAADDEAPTVACVASGR